MAAPELVRAVRSPRGRRYHLVTEEDTGRQGVVALYCGGYLGAARLRQLSRRALSAEAVCPVCLRRFAQEQADGS